MGLTEGALIWTPRSDERPLHHAARGPPPRLRGGLGFRMTRSPYAAFAPISFTASCKFIAPSTPSKVSSVGLPSSLSER